MAPGLERESTDWAGDADWAQLQQEPLRASAAAHGRVLVLLLLVWAALAQVDEVTRGEGKVVPTSQVQVIQSVDGGVVEEILVREGRWSTRASCCCASIRPASSRIWASVASQLALQAKAIRLKALTRGSAFSPPPSSSATRRTSLP